MAWLDDFLLENAPGDREEQKRLARLKILRQGPGAAPEIPVPEVNISEMGPFGYMTGPKAPPPMVGPPEEGAFTGGATGSWGDPAQGPAKAPGGPRALPQAMGRVQGAPGGQNAPVGPSGAPGGAATGQPAPATQGGAVDPLEARILEERKRLDAALATQDELLKPPDRTAMEAAYNKRAAAGGKHMALALLANEAKLEPFSAQHLKQAAEARAPMKMAGGTMTDEGFISDPAYEQEMKLRRADGRLKQIEQAYNNALSAQERERLKKMELAARKELQDAMIASQQFIAGQASADRRYQADLAHGDRVAKAGGKAGKGVPSQAETEDVLNQIERLLPHSTGSYAGAWADQGARFFGHATEGAKAGGAIAPLSARILMAVPRFEGPQGEKDVKIYQEAAGQLSDTTIPIEQRQAAIQTIRYLNQKYPSGGGGAAAGGGGVVNYSDLR